MLTKKGGKCGVVWHFVAFSVVIVKFKALPDHVAQGKTGNRMNMRLRGFSLFYMCHLTPFCAVS